MKSFSLDLLRLRPVRALVNGSGFPYVFQAGMLVVFVLLAYMSWGQQAPAGVSDKLFAKTHLVQLLIWGLWWPGMVWVAVILGRVWCAVCPLELVSNVSGRVGRWLGIGQWRLGRWLASGALIFVIYGGIQLLVAGAHLHRVPAYTSIFLLAMLGCAALAGLLWRDRAFCRGFCPVGLLLDTYGRGGMLAIRSGDLATCRSCATRGCMIARNRERWQAPSCPSLLNPSKLDMSSDCLLCGHCLDACEPGVMQLQIRSPFHPADTRKSYAPWPIVLFVMLVSGFVAYELCTEWAAAKNVFLWTPRHVANWLGLATGNGWVKGVWTLVVVPAVLWGVLGGLARLTRAADTLPLAWRRLALPVVVIVAAGHMAKGLAKISSWGGFLPEALADPSGRDTARDIASGAQSTPAHLAPALWVSVIGVLLVVVATAFAIREARLANRERGRRLAPVLLLLGALAAFLVAGWAQ